MLVEKLRKINKLFFVVLIFSLTILTVSGCSGKKITKEEFLKNAQEVNQKVRKISLTNEINEINGGVKRKNQKMEGTIEFNMETKKIAASNITLKTTGTQNVDVSNEYDAEKRVLKEVNHLNNTTKELRDVNKYNIQPDFYEIQKILKNSIDSMEFEETSSAYVLKLGKNTDGMTRVLSEQYNLKLTNVDFDELNKEFSLEFDKENFYFKKLNFKLSYDGKKGNFSIDNETVFKDHEVK